MDSFPTCLQNKDFFFLVSCWQQQQKEEEEQEGGSLVYPQEQIPTCIFRPGCGRGVWMSCTVTTGSAEENLLSVNAGLFILASQALWKIAMVLVSGGEEAEKHL